MPRKIMKGKEFEKICLQRAEKDEANGLYTMSKYGEKAVFDPSTKLYRALKSQPDFEGVLPGGRQFVIEAKVLGPNYASFPWDSSRTKDHQLKFMKKRWQWGVPSFFLIHCEARPGTPRNPQGEPSMTVALPTDPEMECWKEIERGERKSFKRSVLQEIGFLVHWSKANPTDRKALPNFLPAIRHFATVIDALK